ncbi:MAG: aspartyl protease family protein [Bacteroidales bacterium]|jgi:predicted aspartyl protease
MIIKIPIRKTLLDEEGYHLFIDAELDSNPVNLLIDTGASKTVLDITRIKKILKKKRVSFGDFNKLSTGLGTNTMKSHSVNVSEFSIAALKLTNYTAILLDMAHVNKSYKLMRLKPIDGVIGSDLLMKYKAVIDYNKLILKLTI